MKNTIIQHGVLTMSHGFRVKKQALACHYSWENACILLGAIALDNKLYVKSMDVYKHTPIEEIAGILKKHTSLTPNINLHPPLAECLGNKCVQIDFEGENLAMSKAFEDSFFSMKSQDKIILDHKINVSLIERNIDCFKILLLALNKECYSGTRVNITPTKKMMYSGFSSTKMAKDIKF